MLPVGELRRALEVGHLTHLHRFHRVLPARDDRALAQRELERLAAWERRGGERVSR